MAFGGQPFQPDQQVVVRGVAADPQLPQVTDQLPKTPNAIGIAGRRGQVAAQPRGLPAGARVPQQRQQMIGGVFGGRPMAEDAQRVDADAGIGQVDHHQVLDIGKGALVFAGLARIEDVQPRAQRQPGPDQQLADVGLAPPGRSADDEVGRVLPVRCAEQVEQHHIAQAGAGQVHAKRHPGGVAQRGRQQRHELGEPLGGGGVAELAERGGSARCRGCPPATGWAGCRASGAPRCSGADRPASPARQRH